MNEKEILDGLDKYQKRYLKRRCCGLCEKPLNTHGCNVAYEPLKCSEKMRVARINDCLSKYKPRVGRRKEIIQKERLEKANKIINAIAAHGRHFFRNPDTCAVSSLYLAKGRVYFHDSWSNSNIYIHYPGRWKGFTNGGTMRSVIEDLRNYVKKGEPINVPHHFGPWPEWYCRGDLWGYGKDEMEKVREEVNSILGGS